MSFSSAHLILSSVTVRRPGEAVKAGSYRAGQGRAPGHKRQLRDVVASLLTHTVRMAQQLGPLLLRSCQISSFSLCEPRARRGVFTPDKGAYCFWKSSSRGYEAWRQGDTSVGCSGCPQLQLVLAFSYSPSNCLLCTLQAQHQMQKQ